MVPTAGFFIANHAAVTRSSLSAPRLTIIVRQWALQRLCFIPWRAHTNAASSPGLGFDEVS
jgi:hypothetical protein